MQQEFGAPWSLKLKAITAATLAVGLYAVYREPGWGVLVLVGVALFSAAFAIRGYRVADGRLSILHWGRTTSFDLATLDRVEVQIGATLGSVRTMGIGGLFSFAGHFYNSSLGAYKAYATNDLNTVVLVLNGKTLVVTPDNPAAFADAVEAASLHRKQHAEADPAGS